MSLIGLDLNATRARAVGGPRPQSAAALRLDGEHFDLPLALSLEARQPVLGRAGATLCRRLPHLACLDFLPHLGAGRTWNAGRHSLDADRALGLVFESLRRNLSGASGLALALPAYLSEPQLHLLRRLAEKARWRLLGSVPTPVAAVLAALAQAEAGGDSGLPPGALVLVGDVDGYALTWSLLEVTNGQVRHHQSHWAPHLARAAWLRRLLDGAAQRCVRVCRRDPRQSAEAEQSLYDQLGGLEATPVGPLDLSVRVGEWSQHLMFHPDELSAFVVPLLQQALGELDFLLSAAGGHPGFRGLHPGLASVSATVLTPAAGRLPGLAAALAGHLDRLVLAAPDSDAGSDEGSDYGEGLLEEEEQPTSLHVLGPEAIARVAHDLAVRVHAGDLPGGHLDAVPLSAPPDPGRDAGPARLNFRGQDHILSGPLFTLGRDPACDLVFESERYPTVSARHCEILFDHAYLLCDRSRHGTLLNDHPVRQSAALHSGDWIRLGPSGPILRFLGRPTGRTILRG
jgi:hypothetical protein